MPFINTMTTKKIAPATEESIAAEFGKAITCLGKSESWLMLNFEDESHMYFRGDKSEDMAMVEISLFGKASSSSYDKMTAQVTDIISVNLGISPDKIYVKYDEVDSWGWNGNNF